MIQMFNINNDKKYMNQIEYKINDNNIDIDTSNSFLYFYKRNEIKKEDYIKSIIDELDN